VRIARVIASPDILGDAGQIGQEAMVQRYRDIFLGAIRG
jgi:hypothetical protein